MIGGGSATALRLAEASLSEVGAFLKAWNGPEVLHRLTALANDFDGHADALIAGLRALCDKLFARQRPLSLFIGSAEAYATWERALAELRFGTAEPVRTVLPLADRRAKAPDGTVGGQLLCAGILPCRPASCYDCTGGKLPEQHLFSGTRYVPRAAVPMARASRLRLTAS